MGQKISSLTSQDLATFSAVTTLQQNPSGSELERVCTTEGARINLQGALLQSEQGWVYIVPVPFQQFDLTQAIDSCFPEEGEAQTSRGFMAQKIPFASLRTPFLSISTSLEKGARVDVTFTYFSQADATRVNQWHWPTCKVAHAVTVEVAPSSIKYNLIQNREETRHFFPGFKVPFTLHYQEKSCVTHLTSAPQGTRIGESKGTYFSKGIGNLLYNRQPVDNQIKVGDTLDIEAIIPGHEYKITNIRRV